MDRFEAVWAELMAWLQKIVDYIVTFLGLEDNEEVE